MVSTFQIHDVPALLTAIAALIAAIAAFTKVFANAHHIVELTGRVEQLESENKTLTNENHTLFEENRRLSVRLTATLRKNEEQRERIRELMKVNEQYRKDLATVIAKLTAQGFDSP